MLRRWPPTVITLLTLAACKPRHEPGEVERLVPLTSAPVAAPSEPVSQRPSPARPSRARGDAGTAAFISDRPAPRGALGVDFGAPKAEILQRNAAAHIECRDAAPYLFCPRPLVQVPVPALITYEFRGDRLSSVALDATRTRDEAVLAREYDALLAWVSASLGAPALQHRRVGPGCAGHLPLCLTSHQSELSAHWPWRDSAQVMLSVDQTEDDALMAQAAVTWLSPAQLHDAASDAGP